jgi:hypothetical protein
VRSVTAPPQGAAPTPIRPSPPLYRANPSSPQAEQLRNRNGR